MNAELQQGATNVIVEKAPAWIASVFAAIIGNAEGVDIAIRAFSALPLALLSCAFVYGQIKKDRLERRIYHLQIEKMEEDKADRKGEEDE